MKTLFSIFQSLNSIRSSCVLLPYWVNILHTIRREKRMKYSRERKYVLYLLFSRILSPFSRSRTATPRSRAFSWYYRNVDIESFVFQCRHTCGAHRTEIYSVALFITMFSIDRTSFLFVLNVISFFHHECEFWLCTFTHAQDHICVCRRSSKYRCLRKFDFLLYFLEVTRFSVSLLFTKRIKRYTRPDQQTANTKSI